MHNMLKEYFMKTLYLKDGSVRRPAYSPEEADERAGVTVRDKIIGGQKFGFGKSVFGTSGTWRPDAQANMCAREYRYWRRHQPTDEKAKLIKLINYKINDLRKDIKIMEIAKFINTTYWTLYNRRVGKTKKVEKYRVTNRALDELVKSLEQFRTV